MAAGNLISELIGDWIVRRRNARRIAMLRERVRTTMIDRAFRRLEQSRFGMDDGELAYGERPHLPSEARGASESSARGRQRWLNPSGYAVTRHNVTGAQ